jgi:Hint domain
MTNTITGTYTTLVTLDAAIDNPTTITQYGLLTDSLQVSYQGLTVVNAGSIAGGAGPSSGVLLTAAGSVTNQSGGTISGHYGITGEAGAAVTVVNAGSIAGSSRGIFLLAGGSVTNQSGGAISGIYGIYGRSFGGAAVTVVNAGSITGANEVGVFLLAGGSATNQSGGYISGAAYGIFGGDSAMTVVNAGTIAGGSDAVSFAAGYANRLVIDPGAVFSGTVTGGNAIGAAQVSTLELASAGSAGTLSGLGTQFVDFAQVTVDAGAQWTLTGANTLASGDTITNAGTLMLSDATLSGAAAFINNGAIVLDPSTMTIASLTGSGSVTIEAGSTLDVTGAIASTETIVFAGPGASLLLGTPDSATGAVTGFTAGDTIDLAGIAPGSVSDAGGTVSFTGGSFPLTATIPLVIEPDGNGGTDIVACFAADTRIATPDGPVRVETLQAGDRVLTASGDVRPVRWIGFRTIDLTRHPAPDQVQPIRIAAGAFAEGVPSRDLRLSPDHAVLLHGLLIPIKLLRNDASITREIDCRSVTYYHVELDAHDILLAEGLAAESYLDTGNRAMFENADLPMSLHPDLTNGQARRERESCAPFADQPAVVEPIWRTLAARVEQMGLAPTPMPETTDDPALHLMVDGRRCAPVSAAHGCYTFLVEGHASAVRLVSRHAERPDTAPWIADSRRLGVQLRAMTIRRGGDIVPVPLDHPLLAEGWWAPEWHAPTTLRRWTKGDAAVPMMEAGPGSFLLEVEVAATVPYPFPSAAKEAVARPVTSMAA